MKHLTKSCATCYSFYISVTMMIAFWRIVIIEGTVSCDQLALVFNIEKTLNNLATSDSGFDNVKKA
jgi:hypothetical protein